MQVSYAKNLSDFKTILIKGVFYGISRAKKIARF